MLGKWLELLSAYGGRFVLNQLLFADDTALVADSEDTRQTEVRLDGRCEGGLGPRVISDLTPMLWWLSPGEEWDAVTRLHDAVGINCKKWRNYWKSRGRCQVYGLSGVCLMIVCVCVIWLDMTTPPWWREKVMVYYYYYYIFIVLNSNYNNIPWLSPSTKDG